MECSAVHESHCSTCYRAACKDVSCPPVPCPNACGSTLHPCKLEDHQRICSAAVVPCLNCSYGCTAKIQRSKLGPHLSECPASVVVCKYSWKRYAVEGGVVSKKDTPPLFDEELLRADTKRLHACIASDSNIKLGMEVHPGQEISRMRGDSVSARPWVDKTQHKLPKYVFWCLCTVRRQEASDHFRWHQAQNSLDGAWFVHHCPNHIYGCGFAVQRIVPRGAGSRVAFNRASHSLMVKTPQPVLGEAPAVEGRYMASIRKKQELALYGYSTEEPLDPLSQLPSLIIQQVLVWLDSYSLCALARVNSHFKELCSGLVKTRGVVELAWSREERPGMYRKWQERDEKVWFFTQTPSLPAWTYSQERAMLCAHMERCKVLKRNQTVFSGDPVKLAVWQTKVKVSQA